MIDPANDTVLITGAAGAIGTALRAGLRPAWRHLRLTDARPIRGLLMKSRSPSDVFWAIKCSRSPRNIGDWG